MPAQFGVSSCLLCYRPEQGCGSERAYIVTSHHTIALPASAGWAASKLQRANLLFRKEVQPLHRDLVEVDHSHAKIRGVLADPFQTHVNDAKTQVCVLDWCKCLAMFDIPSQAGCLI